MAFQRLRACAAAFATTTLLGAPAAAAPRTIDPLVAVSALGTAESRAAVCPSDAAGCGGGSLTTAASAGAAVAAGAAQDGREDGPVATNGSMWPLWLGLGAVAIFIAWDLLDDDEDGEIRLPISP